MLMTLFALAACGKHGEQSFPVGVDHAEAFSAEKEPDPLMLVIEIAGDGKLRLNKIETGTISEPGALAEKLEVIFDDRAMAGIQERGVVINPQGELSSTDLQYLIDRLTQARASPIRIVDRHQR